MGAIALTASIVETYGPQGVTDLGIYNCRRVAGTLTWSVHAEGRACDLGVSGASRDVSYGVLHVLLNAGDVVLQRIMYDGRIYDRETPAGRPITAGSPHVDHLHVELSQDAAAGRIPLELVLDDLGDDVGEDLEMPSLLVGWRGAQWAVAPGLVSKRGIAQTSDVEALARAGYVPAVLSDALMAKIPGS